MASSTLTLGYWDIRGLAEPIRTLLAYLELPYESKKVTKYEDWITEKRAAQHNFPNLPYLVDGEKTITETEAIQVHLCLKANRPDLIGKDSDRVEFIQLRGVIGDFNSGITNQCYANKTREDLKKAVETAMGRLGGKLNDLNKILEKRDFLLGYITYLDFNLAELIERFVELDAEVGTAITTGHSALLAHSKRVLELPGVKEYRASDKFQSRPHNAQMACWF